MSLHLLLPVDDSAYARAAAQVALQLSEALGARLTIAHVVNVRSASGNILKDLPGHLGFEPAVVSDEIVQQHTARAQKLVSEVSEQARARGVDVEEKIVTGTVSGVITDLAAGSDLVVMGLRGETEERFSGQGGALCAWLPQHLDTPVLWAVPGGTPITALAIGYDGSPAAKRGARAVRAIAGPLGVPVHGIFVSADGTGGEVLDDLDSELDDCTVVKHVVQGADPHNTLVETTERVGAELLVLGFHGKSPLKDFVFGTATERIMLSQKVGVLLAH